MEDLEQENWMKALCIKCNEKNDGGQDNTISRWIWVYNRVKPYGATIPSYIKAKDNPYIALSMR